jgi:hypothetical protein
MSRSLLAVQIFLPNGVPHGIRIAELAGYAAQLTDVPRRLLRSYADLPDRPDQGVYILLDEAGSPPSELRIGYSGALSAQLAAHDLDAQGWTRALLLTSRIVGLSEAYGRYLAWLCRRDLRLPGTLAEIGGTGGAPPPVTREPGAECRALWSTGKLLLAMLGYGYLDPEAHIVQSSPSFQALETEPKPPPVKAKTRPLARTHTPAKRPGPRRQPNPLVLVTPTPVSATLERTYRCTLLGCEGLGGPTPDGFVLLKGSRGPRRDRPKLPGAYREFRQSLIESRVLRVDDLEVVLERDYLFSTASLAAIALTGETCDGSMEWKTEDGRTLFADLRERGLHRR